MKTCFKTLLLLCGLLIFSNSIYAQVNDLAATTITGNNTPGYGIPTNFTVIITNPGTNPQSNYLVKLYKTGNIEIACMPGPVINPNEEAQVVLGWIPDSISTTSIFGKVFLTGDQNIQNDQTPNLNVFVVSGGSVICTVGNGSEQAAMPVNMAYRNSLFEAIYYPDEIGCMGVVPRIWFFSNFVTDASHANLNIWMGSTTQNDLSNGWIPSTNLAQVFSGNVNFTNGASIVSITLSTPFVYIENNLVLLVEKVMSDSTSSSQDLFLCKRYKQKPECF